MDKKLTLRYLFEIIVIVFSVTLSFYIQEVLNDREKEELKNQSLNGVIEDLEIDKKFYTLAIDNLFGRIKACEDVLNGDINDDKINYLMSTWGFVGQDANYKSLISTGGLGINFEFTTTPTQENVLSLRPLIHYTQYGTHKVTIYHVNEEYALLYETSTQDSRDLNEPYTNINNGLGIFSGFASQEVYFEVIKQ